MKWFDIVKSTNPYSLYSQEEIEEMAEEVESHMKIYGGRQGKYYGNLEPLGRLRADYNLWSFSNRNTKYNYWIKEIRFELLTDEGYNDNPLSKIYVDVFAVDVRDGEDSNVSGSEELKVLADFVEIYNQPNHRYKNLVATLGKLSKDELKEIIENGDPDNEKQRIILTLLEGLNL